MLGKCVTNSRSVLNVTQPSSQTETSIEAKWNERAQTWKMEEGGEQPALLPKTNIPKCVMYLWSRMEPPPLPPPNSH